MELPKKICSLGILDINLTLELTQKESIKYNFFFNKYNSADELQKFFQQKINLKNNQVYFDIIDHISLSSDNNLINTLLFINRAYNNKSFIEFIVPNQLHSKDNNNIIISIVKHILDKNYIFIIENKINNIPSSIKFIIKIFKDNSKEIIYMKEFDIFKKDDNTSNINDINYTENKSELSDSSKTKNIFSEINYNFSASDYFILDLDSFNNPIWNIENYNNEDISNESFFNLVPFILYIINQNQNIKILTIISKNILNDKQFLNKLQYYKEILELSDIIISNKNYLNYFLKIYNEMFNDYNIDYYYDMNIYKNLYGDKNNSYKDLILYDKDKLRQNIPRITILFNDFDYISIYIQNGINMNLDYIELFFLNSFKNINLNKFNINNYFYFFIGGFLSRFIYNKPFKICASAGQLLLNKIINSSLNNYKNIDDFNIIVPNKKRIKIIKFKEFNKFGKNNLKSNFEFNLIKNDKLKINKNKSFLNDKNLKRSIFIKKSNIILKDSNFQYPLNLNNKKYKYKTTNNLIKRKNKNVSTKNIFGKEKIKRRLLNDTYLPIMQRSSSSGFIFYNDKNNNSKYYQKSINSELKRFNKRPKSNYYNKNIINNGCNFECKNNNYNKLGNSFKILNDRSENPFSFKNSFQNKNYKLIIK